MIRRGFGELPNDYQVVCDLIEKQCHNLLITAQIKFDAIYWSKLNLSNCCLCVIVADKIYSARFGRRAMTHSHEVGMKQSIRVRLKLLADKIKYTTSY